MERITREQTGERAAETNYRWGERGSRAKYKAQKTVDHQNKTRQNKIKMQQEGKQTQN